MTVGLLALDGPPPQPWLSEEKKMAINAVIKAIVSAPIFYISLTIISFSDFSYFHYPSSLAPRRGSIRL